MNPSVQGLLAEIYRVALAAADPSHAVSIALQRSDTVLLAKGIRYDLTDFDRVIAAGAGKATARMAGAVESILGDRLSEGAIVVKYGHTVPLARVRQFEAGHPVPDQAGVDGTTHIRDLVRSADERSLVICLFSGGGSSLLVSPAPGISLADKQRITDLLLRSGASIDELNAVRKHLSRVKGGRLARTAYPATVLSLILSDVIGDRLDIIASGPTAPDRSTFADAAAVIEKYRLGDSLPETVDRFLDRGLRGQEEETVRDDHPCFGRTKNVIIGSIRQAVAAANSKAQEAGLRTEVLTTDLQGEARTAAKMLAERALLVQRGLSPGDRICLLSGGETTVAVRGPGRGGRNQELALAFANEISGIPGITLLSAGTDGTDGPTDAAGAIVSGMTAVQARQLGLSPRAYLEWNDSYEFFRKFDALSGGSAHLFTGPTGTNVMDLQIMLVEAP